jgi:hypothetical protein
LRQLVLLAFAVALPAAAQAAEATPIRGIDISQDANGFVANMTMFAPVPPSVAWAVLTDFDHMASWVPNVRDSKVVAGEGNSLTIEQRGTAKFGIASFPYVSVRQMTLDPQRTVHARQVKGSMKRLESLMTLTPENGGTKLTYRLEMVPSALVSAVLSKEFLEHELSEQFTAIIEEMTRRNR